MRFGLYLGGEIREGTIDNKYNKYTVNDNFNPERSINIYLE